MLGGPNRTLSSQKIEVPSIVQRALSHFGNINNLEHIFKQVMNRLRSEYPMFTDHDTLYAVRLLLPSLMKLGIFTTLMVGYEYYQMANRQYHNILRREHKAELNKHVSLMTGYSAHAPPLGIVSEPRPSTEMSYEIISRDVEEDIKKSNKSTKSEQLSKRSEKSPKSQHTPWVARHLDPGSSKTFAGPFGRMENDVLKRLAKLEKSGQAEAKDNSIGRSVYKSAVNGMDMPSVSRSVTVVSSYGQVAPQGEVSVEIVSPPEIVVTEASTTTTDIRPVSTLGQMTAIVMGMWSPKTSPAREGK